MFVSVKVIAPVESACNVAICGHCVRLGEAWTRVNADKPHRELPHGEEERQFESAGETLA